MVGSKSTPWAALPLFPLKQVVFPGGRLDLRIFEVRYLDMVAKAHQSGTPFGMIALKSGAETRQPPTLQGQATEPEVFFEVGTLVHITQLERPQAGLIEIRCEAGERFHLMTSAATKTGLWMGNAFAFGVDAAIAIPDDLKPIATTLRSFYDRLAAKIGPNTALPFAAQPQYDDAAWVANRWCELLRLPLELRQRLMQLDNPLMRLELVGDLMRRQGLLPK